MRAAGARRAAAAARAAGQGARPAAFGLQMWKD